MKILAYLPTSQLAHLGALAGNRHSVHPANSWTSFGTRLRDDVCDIAVVDPAASGQLETAEVLAFLERFPSTPIVVYTPVVAATMQTVTTLARAGAADVVLYGFDDGAPRFLTLLERRAGDPLAVELLGRIAPALRKLDAELAAAVASLFREPYRFRLADDLAATAGCSRRTMYRQFEGAELASPRIMVLGARLLRGYAYLRDPGHTHEAIAHKLGFSSQRAFSERMREVIGELADRVRRRVPPDEFLTRLASRLRASEG